MRYLRDSLSALCKALHKAEYVPLAATAASCLRLSPLGVDLHLHFSLLRDFQRIIDLDAKVPHRALQFGVAEQELDRPDVLRAPVNQGRLCPAHRVGPVDLGFQPDRGHPGIHNAGVLPRRQMRRLMYPTREQVLVGLQLGLGNPGRHGSSGGLGYLELHRTLRLVLHYHRPRHDLVAVRDIPHPERD